MVPEHQAIGDIKTGAWRREYLLTATGYAMAFESAGAGAFDLGVIYLVDTDPTFLTQGHVVVFLLTDQLRREFLDRRDQALIAATPGAAEPVPVTKSHDKERYCPSCSYLEMCSAREGGPQA